MFGRGVVCRVGVGSDGEGEHRRYPVSGPSLSVYLTQDHEHDQRRPALNSHSEKLCVEFLVDVHSSTTTSTAISVSNPCFYIPFAFGEMIPFVYLEWCRSTK